MESFNRNRDTNGNNNNLPFGFHWLFTFISFEFRNNLNQRENIRISISQIRKGKKAQEWNNFGIRMTISFTLIFPSSGFLHCKAGLTDVLTDRASLSLFPWLILTEKYLNKKKFLSYPSHMTYEAFLSCLTAVTWNFSSLALLFLQFLCLFNSSTRLDIPTRFPACWKFLPVGIFCHLAILVEIIRLKWNQKLW